MVPSFLQRCQRKAIYLLLKFQEIAVQSGIDERLGDLKVRSLEPSGQAKIPKQRSA